MIVQHPSLVFDTAFMIGYKHRQALCRTEKKGDLIMKPIKLILILFACVLLFGGCNNSAGEGNPEEKQESSETLQAYREVILQLQQQIETLRTEQAQQVAGYEEKIAALETLLASMSTSQAPSENESEETSTPVTQDYTYAIRDGGAVITSYLGSQKSVQIPDRIEGYPVVAIGEGAFRNSKVEEVILPTGVTTIDWFAFYGSYRLQSVTLPASVNVIEYGAFELCSAALKFTCPKGSYAAQYASSYGISVIEG